MYFFHLFSTVPTPYTSRETGKHHWPDPHIEGLPPLPHQVLKGQSLTPNKAILTKHGCDCRRLPNVEMNSQYGNVIQIWVWLPNVEMKSIFFCNSSLSKFGCPDMGLLNILVSKQRPDILLAKNWFSAVFCNFIPVKNGSWFIITSVSSQLNIDWPFFHVMGNQSCKRKPLPKTKSLATFTHASDLMKYRRTCIWRTTVRQTFGYDRRYAWSQSYAYQVPVCVICICQTLHMTDHFPWSNWVCHMQVCLYILIPILSRSV